MSVFIIAEAGVNHNGDIAIAKKLIDIAVSSGCNAVKFQTFKADNIVVEHAEKAEYQKINCGASETQLEMLKRLELDRFAHEELMEYCIKKNIMFLSTPFDIESVDLLNNLGIEVFKIPSGEITNKPLIQYIAAKQKPIILSTGMATLGEIEEALDWIEETANVEVTLLHCTSNYPAAKCEVNLCAIQTLKQAFRRKVGYSDHTEGIEIPIAAVAMGAEVIEKHFTLDKSMEGPDHKASLEPNELHRMVEGIRNVELAMGDGRKRPTASEVQTRLVARKSIVAASNIQRGEIITRGMLTVKRPGTGKAPKHIDEIIGQKADKDYKKDEQL